MKTILETGLQELKLHPTKNQLNLWIRYIELLKKWNKIYNLSGITDPKMMMVRHVLDSLCVAEYLNQDNIHVVADIGTGAGAPGVPLAILFPHKKFILVDSRQKRMIFLKQVVFDLGLKNIELCHGRVEQLPVPIHQPDRIISRAFAKLTDMLNLTQSWAKADTIWLAMKGEVRPEELTGIPQNYTEPTLIRLNPPFETAIRHVVIIQQV